MSAAGSSAGHERWEGDAAAYVLGGLEEPELEVFEQHLAGCARCREEVAAMREGAEALPLAAATVAPPRRLKARVMDTVRAEAAGQATGSQPLQKPKRRWSPEGMASPGWPRLAAAVASGVVVAAIVVALTLGSGGTTRTYAGVVYVPGASASVRQSAGSAQLRVSRLPAPPVGRIYQVWLRHSGQSPVPTSALFSASTGSVALPGNLRGVQAVLVTAEPKPSGSRKPTRPPIIVVRLT